MPESPTTHWAKALDIVMLAVTAGLERTLQEYDRLLTIAGLELVGVTRPPPPSRWSRRASAEPDPDPQAETPRHVAAGGSALPASLVFDAPRGSGRAAPEDGESPPCASRVTGRGFAQAVGGTATEGDGS